MTVDAPNQSSKVTKRVLIALIVLTLSVAVALYQQSLNRSPIQTPGYYKVITVVDGDTIVVDMNGTKERVRLIGVDTPETHHPSKGVECFGLKASDYTKQNIEGKNVRLEADKINQNRDRYQRLLRYVYTEDGRNWNAEIISSGHGQALLAFPFTKIDEFESLEKEARENNAGLWSACSEFFD